MIHLAKTTLFLTLLLVGSLVHQLQAQEVIATNEDNYFARNSIFVELLGNGILYSLNYDHKFFDHASARIGGMFLSYPKNDVNNDNGRTILVLVPIMVNYLVGNGNSRLEVGGGILAGGTNGSAQIENERISEARGGGAFTGNIGYRLQPRDGGFLFRIGFTPVISSAGFLPWAGLSLGATF